MPETADSATPHEIGDVRIQDVVGIKEQTQLERLISAQAFWVTVALALIVGLMSYLQPEAFATTSNFYNITRNFAPIAIMALGMVAVIITGGIDLSVGSVMGVVGVVCGMLLEAQHTWYVALLAGLATGMVAGAINGLLIAYAGLSAFVVTLGMLSFARSVAVVLSQNKMIIDFGPSGPYFKIIGGGQLLGVSNMVWVMILLAIIREELLMLKLLTTAAFVAGSLAAGLVMAGQANAQDKLVIAISPKALNNPFFDQAKLGCEKAVSEIGADKVECLWVGPSEHGGGDEQVQIVADMIAKGVDGIAVAPSNAAAMASVLPEAKAKGIPILTWDSDLLPESKDLRTAYIGTFNYDIGVNLAKVVQKIKPKGGTLCIQSGGAAAANHNERMQGIRDTLSGAKSAASPGDRLTGQNGWTEVDGCPLYTNDDFPLAVQQEEDILGKYPDLDAFIPTGGFAQFLPDANRSMLEPHKGRIADGSLALAVADTLPMQIDQLREGYASGLVGQWPFEMGYKVIYAIYDMANGKPAPTDPTYTGLDVCTPENVDTCVGGGG